MLNAMYKIFDESPAKRADYEQITTAIESDFALQFCSHRWIENARMAERAGNIWEKYLQIIDFWKNLPKSKQPGQGKPGTNKSYDTLLKRASDLLVPVKLKFFKEVADRLSSFLVTFQKANSTLKLIKFDFFYNNIYRPDVEVGYGIAEESRKLKSKGKIKDG